MKTTKQQYMDYIADSFDCEAMEIPEASTAKVKAKKFCELIKDRHSEYEYKNVQDHIQGLGEYIDLDYMNCDILDRAKEYGVIDNMLANARYSKYKDRELALERVEEQITMNYWATIAKYICQLAK